MSAPLHYSFLDRFLPASSSPDGFLHLTVTYAASLDSRISLRHGLQTKLSGPESKQMTHYLRSKHEAILVGVGTAIADDPGLNCRFPAQVSRGLLTQPRPVVLDPHGRWKVHRGCRAVRTAREEQGKGPWVLCAAGCKYPPEQKAVLEESGGQVIEVPMSGSMMSWKDITFVLSQHGIRSLMVEGGGRVINQILRPENEDQVSAVIITIAPVFLGCGGTAVNPDRREGAEGQPIPSARLRDVIWQVMGEDAVLCGRLGSM